jgi:23S rRNA pseudouridine2605 synthase
MSQLPLVKAIFRKTSLSRRRILALMMDGQIQVNGTIIKDLNKPVNTTTDRITIEGQKLEFGIPKLVYYKLNKPKGIITTLSDPQGRKTILDLISRLPEKVVPVGRLDRDTTGLLLLTNDGELANRVSHPTFAIQKVYRVAVDHPLTKATLARLESGLILEDGPFKFHNVINDDPRMVTVTISEGRNRIIRRAFAQLGYKVVRLKRLSIGPINVNNVDEGHIKPLSIREIASLKRLL